MRYVLAPPGFEHSSLTDFSPSSGTSHSPFTRLCSLSELYENISMRLSEYNYLDFITYKGL